MMSLAKMKRLTAMADAFNAKAAQFDQHGAQLVAEREALVAMIRETGIVKDEAEAMIAKVKYAVQMPDAEEEQGELLPAGEVEQTIEGSLDQGKAA